MLNRFVEEEVLTGCGLQVYRDGALLYSRCAGDAAVLEKTPLTERTRLRIYSLTKTFTCACAMMLYEQGRFALDDPVALYIPEFADMTVCTSPDDLSSTIPVRTPVTIRHLMTMTSGISYMAFIQGTGNAIEESLLRGIRALEADAAAGKPHTLHDLIDLIARTPLAFQPGEHWLYGLNLSVLGYLVEILSGKRLSDFMRETLWEPLGMTGTCFNYEIPDDQVANQTIPEALWAALGLQVSDEEAKPTAQGRVYGSKKAFMPAECLGFELPCGGMVSTLHDLGIYFAMLANGGTWNGKRFLSPRTIDLMRTNELTPTQLSDFAQEHNRGYGYGLGYRTMLEPAKAGFYMPEGSFGWDGASGCYALADPSRNMAVVFAEQSLPHHISYTIPRVIAALNADLF